MSTALERSSTLSPPGLPTDEELQRYWRLGEMFHQARVYTDISMAQQAIAKMIVGRDLGLSVAQSMQGIQFVKGRIMFHYPLLAMLIRSRGYSWRTIERSATMAKAMVVDPEGKDIEEVSFSMEDAITAKLLDRNPNYRLYPRNMLWARMMGDIARFVVPEAFGGMPVYVAEAEVIEDDELSSGEGAGPSEAFEFSPSVLAVIERAEALGHGLADRGAWQMKVGRIDRPVEEMVAEAHRELDEFESRKRDEEPSDGGPEPDVPIDGADLPEPVPPEAPTEAPPAPSRRRRPRPEASPAPAEKDDAERLRARIRQVSAKEPRTPEEQIVKDEELTDLEARLAALGEEAAADDPGQQRLLG